MASSLSNRSLLNTTVSSDVTMNVPGILNFSDLQFQTIGQTPDLLKRMSVPNTVSQMFEDSSSERASLSPEPDLFNELLTSESSDNAPDLPKQPTLRERLAITDDGPIEATNPTTNSSETQPSSIFNWKPNQTKITTFTSSDRSTTTLEASKTISLIHSPSVNDTPIASSSTSHPQFRTSATLGDNDALQQTPTIPPNSVSVQSAGRNLEEALYHASHVTGASTSATTTIYSEPPIFTALQALQVRLETSLANLSPINTQDAVRLACSAKDQCKEVSASAKRACSLAQKALTAAEESMSAAKECLAVAETIQARTDEALVAVNQISNGGREQLWNNTVKILTAGLHELDEWSRQMESRHHEQAEREKQRQNQRLAAQRQDDGSNIQRTSSTISSIVTDHHLPPLASTSTSLTEPLLMTVEREAGVIAQAWNQLREQSAEKRRADEEEVRKSLEYEERYEHEQDKACSILATASAEPIAAKEKGKAFQEKEAQEAELQQQRLERKREEVRHARKASEDRTLKTTQEKEKAERKEALRRAQQEDQRRKEMTDREAHEQLLAAKKARALEEQAFEEQRQQQLREQEVKRQEVAAQKQQAASKDAERIRSDRAKLKQSRAQVENPLTPPVQNVSLPITPSCSYESLLQVRISAQHNESGLGHANNSPTENPDTSWETAEKTASHNTNGSSLLHRIAAFATSSTEPLTSTARFPNLDHQSFAPPASTALDAPANDAINSPSRAVAAQSDPSSHFTENVSVDVGRNENAAGVAQQTPKDNKSLPPLKILPLPLPSALGTRPTGLPNKPVHGSGQQRGNASSIPRSLSSPIAQRADLHALVTNTSVIAESVQVKVELKDDSPLMGLERISAALMSSKPSASSQNNSERRASPSKREAESPFNIPLLSLPSPPAHTTSFKETASPIEKTQTSEAERPRPKPQHQGRKLSTGYVSNSTQILATQQYDAGANLEAPALPNPSLMATLPSKPSGLAIQGAPKPTVQYHDYDAGTRVAPDTVKADAWIQPSASQENNQDLGLNQRQGRAQSPARLISRGDRHYSPLPGAIRVQQQTRPHRGDHIPPRRGRSPLPVYNGYVSPVRSNSRGSSGNNSRLATPELPLYQNQPFLHQGMPLKRKRLHLNDQVGGPPQRRPRYEDQRTHEGGSHNHSGTEYVPTYIRNDFQADWSNVANYSRSPSPEPPRAPPLYLRMKESDRTYRPPTPEAFRPPPLHPRLEESDRHYKPNQRLNNQHTDLPLDNRQPPTQGLSYHDEPSKYQSGYMPRQNVRQPTSDSRPPLLDRFTDPPPNNYHAQHSAPGRGSRPRVRGGIHQPSAPRNSKGHLIDRLGNA